MSNRKRHISLISILAVLSMGAEPECQPTARTRSGIKQAMVDVPTDPSGMTVEQQNVRNRLLMDNKPGSIKHLYVISAYSGQVLIYSTVKGKVTSSGKRLAPSSGSTSGGSFTFPMGGELYGYTNEVLADDGTYGSSVEYLYWWDEKGVYHQHYVSGGQILHVSDQPLSVKSVIINMEVSGTPPPG